MARRWLTLALVFLALGCFRNHGRDADDGGVDAGVDALPDTAPDAPGCFTQPIAFVDSLECPTSAIAGDSVTVSVTHSAGLCCGSGMATLSARNDGRRQWSIEGQWTVCDCCIECDCIGPIETDRVTLGPLEAGTHVVRAAGAECTIRVDEPSACELMRPEEVRAPRVLFEGQDLAFSLTQREAVGCSCQPRLRRVPEDAFTAEICNCCEECLCIDPGYEVAYVGPRVSVPPTVIDGVTLPTEHRDLDSCRRTSPTGLRIAPPDDRVLRDGPAIWWAVVSGMETVCCVEPFGGVVELDVGAAGTHLDLYSCVDFDCECVGRPTPFEAWHPLGELAPGGYLIRAGEHEVSFMVPGR